MLLSQFRRKKIIETLKDPSLGHVEKKKILEPYQEFLRQKMEVSSNEEVTQEQVQSQIQ